MKKKTRFILCIALLLAALGLGGWWLYSSVLGRPLQPRLGFAPEDVTRIEVRHAGGEAEPWVCEDPEEVLEAAEYLAGFRYIHTFQAGERSGWLDMVEVATPSETYRFELYPNAIEIGETLYYGREDYFSPWLALAGGEESPPAPWY